MLLFVLEFKHEWISQFVSLIRLINTLVETKENNKRFHQLHNIQPKKNNEQQDYKNTNIATATETLLNCSWRKKEETVILHDTLCRQHRATEGGNEMTRKAPMKH